MSASIRPSSRPTYGQAVTDRFGTAHSSTSRAAVAAFGDAVQGVAEHRPTSAAALERALAADRNLIAGHALKGFGGVLLARRETVEAAATALHEAHRACARKGSATPEELMLVHALQDAVQGRMCAAADCIDRHLAAAPENLLFVKLVQSLRFMAGDLVGMCGSIERVATAWSPATPGYGFMLGCRAFTLEEKGDFGGAERVGRDALAHAPTDAWGLHAVAHVYEMTGRTAEGIAWLDETRENWAGCNNFFFHLAWHLALFQLECGRYQRVLDLYDEAVRPRSTDDFRDVANAASLLWRLRQEGVEVGNRWRELAEIAHRRRHEAELVFATLHYLLALVATGDLAAARELVASLQTRADTGTDDQAVVAAAVGLPVARAILDLAQGGAKGDVPELAMLARRLPRVGGSHAQRDVFVRTLTELAARRGDLTTVRAILSLRRRLKREDRFVERFGPQRTAPVPAWHPRHATLAPPTTPAANVEHRGSRPMTTTRRALLAGTASAAVGAVVLLPCTGSGETMPTPPINMLASEAGIAIKGTDPVAYFVEGRPRAGRPEIAVEYKGARWLLSSVENKVLFQADPERYVPAYGGYCAYGVARGYLVKIEPEAWTIHEGRLYLNYDLGVRRTWLQDIAGYTAKADRNFPKLVRGGG